VLRSRATERETNFAFGVVRQLFEPPLAEASELEPAVTTRELDEAGH
jgi:hypothetical protein